MTGFPVTPVRMIEDEKENSLWAWAKSRTEWRSEVVDTEMQWDYEGMLSNFPPDRLYAWSVYGYSR